MKRADRMTTIMFNDEDTDAEISTANRKWINKLNSLVEEGHAEELEETADGHRDFLVAKNLIRLPFFRKPREWTEEQKEAARVRLAGVRDVVAAGKAEAAAAAEEEEEEAPKPKRRRKRKAKAKVAVPVEPEPEPEPEPEEEEEEVVVRRPRRRKKAAAKA